MLRFKKYLFRKNPRTVNSTAFFLPSRNPCIERSIRGTNSLLKALNRSRGEGAVSMGGPLLPENFRRRSRMRRGRHPYR